MKPSTAWLALGLCLLPACRPSPPTTALPPAQAAPPALCPEPTALRVLYPLRPTPPGHSALWLYEGHLNLPLEEAEEDRYDFAPIIAPLAPDTQVPPGWSPSWDPVWVLGPGEPCRLEPGPPTQLTQNLGGATFTILARPLQGDCALQEPVSFAFQQATAPVGCHHIEAEDRSQPQGPPEALAALDPPSCQPPGCSLERQFQSIHLQGQPAVVSLHGARYPVDAQGYPDCNDVQMAYDIWWRTTPTAPWRHWEQWDNNLGALYDKSGVRAVTTRFQGQAVLQHPGAQELFVVDWAYYHEEDGADDMYPCGL